MNSKKRIRQTMVATAVMFLCMPMVRSEAAVITSNATDKIAVVFDESKAYSAGDYITYEGEMYICTDDIQGAWDSAKDSFMQLTKNREIGTGEELTAVYDASRDPSKEKSLMAFTANAWQKLKSFLGIENKDAKTDADAYKNSSVSAKLNYLERQNANLEQNLGELHTKVTQSFQYVSDGKSILADAISDNGVKVGPSETFATIHDSILKLVTLKYQQGEQAGLAKGKSEGMEEGKEAGYAQGREEGFAQGKSEGYTEGKNAGYAEGKTAGVAEGRDAGIAEADARVNTESASYKEGMAAGGLKSYSHTIQLTFNGPDKEAGSFVSTDVTESGDIIWLFKKNFSGHQIASVYMSQNTNGMFAHSYWWATAIWDGSNYIQNYDGGNTIDISNDTVSWGGFRFNESTDSCTTLTVIIIYS